MDLSDIVNDLGLTSAGIASAGDPPSELEHLTAWLDRRYNGRMDFLARDPEKRCDVRRTMHGCRTVIVAAMKYDSMPLGHTYTISAQNTPKYLLHEDYHIVMMKKLEALIKELKRRHPAARFKCYVDTGPVLEKAWAAKAGLGFIGKNTLLISQEHGSQMALGVVLTDMELRPATCVRPVKPAGCGSCTRCLDACPTNALVAPYVLDARKCISYKFFIEKKHGGCDVCQEVCPYNGAGRRP